MRILLVLTIIFLTTLHSGAQILKINRTDLAVDTAGIFKGSLNLNLNMNNSSATPEENLVYTGIEFGSNLTYFSQKHAYLLLNNLNYFRITGGPVVSTGHAHVRTNFLRKRALSYELFSQVQYDKGRNLTLRYLFGGGVRIKLLKGQKGNLYAGIGIMNEFERWDPFIKEGYIDKQIWKSTNYLSGTILVSKSFSINIINYYQGGYDDESEVFRHRISGDVSFEARITGKLAFATTFTLQYESDPVIHINPINYNLTNGLTLNL